MNVLMFSFFRFLRLDCGIHTSLYLKHWKPRVKMHDLIKVEDIANIWIRLANEMMFTDHNMKNDHKKLVLEFQSSCWASLSCLFIMSVLFNHKSLSVHFCSLLIMFIAFFSAEMRLVMKKKQVWWSLLLGSNRNGAGRYIGFFCL